MPTERIAGYELMPPDIADLITKIVRVTPQTTDVTVLREAELAQMRILEHIAIPLERFFLNKVIFEGLPKEDAEDIMQEILLQTISPEKLTTFDMKRREDPRQNFWNWTLKSADYKIIDFYRRRQREREIFSRHKLEDETQHKAARVHTASKENQAHPRLTEVKILKAFDENYDSLNDNWGNHARIKQENRALLELACGLMAQSKKISAEYIATQLGIPVATVKTRMNRLRNLLSPVLLPGYKQLYDLLDSQPQLNPNSVSKNDADTNRKRKQIYNKRRKVSKILEDSGDTDYFLGIPYIKEENFEKYFREHPLP